MNDDNADRIAERLSTLEEFSVAVEEIYGSYLDQRAGLDYLVKRLKRYRSADDDAGSRQTFSYGKGNPNDPAAVQVHQSELDEAIKRASPGGKNRLMLGNMTVVLIYTLWEKESRRAIEISMGLDKDQLKHPVMGDLRRLRRSVVHRRGLAADDIGKCEVFKWFAAGEEVRLDSDKINTIILAIREMVGELKSNDRKRCPHDLARG